MAREDQPDITLFTGTTVAGHLVGTDGEPLAGVTLDLQSVDRRFNRFYGPVTYGTDDQGRFRFENVPANTRIEIFGGMEELRGHGVPQPVMLTTGDNDTTIDAGEIQLEPGYTIRGRVITSDGRPLPAEGRKANLGARADALRVDTAEDGAFVFENVPAGLASMSVQLPGYHISRWNPIRDQNNRRIAGTISGDVDEYSILMDPGIDRPLVDVYTLRTGEIVPIFRGLEEVEAQAFRALGALPKAVRIEPGAPDAQGWQTWPRSVQLRLPEDTSAESPSEVTLTIEDPIRPYLPAIEERISVTHELWSVPWPHAFLDARVLRFSARSDGLQDTAILGATNQTFETLVLHEPQEPAGEHRAIGRVLDMLGQPIPGACIIPESFWKNGTGQYPWPGGTRLTLSRDDGAFEIGAHEAYEHVRVRVKAPGHAPQAFDLSADSPSRDLRLRAPVRLTANANAVDGASAPHTPATLWQRNLAQYWSIVDARFTNEHGRVTFEHAPSGEPLQILFGGEEGQPLWPALELEPIEAGDRAIDFDAGTVQAVEGAVVSGQLVTVAAAVLQERPALVLHRLSTEELKTGRPVEDGSFAFAPVAAGEPYVLSVHGPVVLHHAQPSIIMAFAPGATAIGGRLEGRTHVRLLVNALEAGEPSPQFANQQPGLPLRSFDTRRASGIPA